jgi:hypothetical protein
MQMLYHLSACFALDIFRIMSPIFSQACLNCDLPIYASKVARVTDMQHHSRLVV